MKKKIVAIILIICLVVGSANFFAFDLIESIAGFYEIFDKDREIAENLSNMTGKSADSIMKLKSSSSDWNEVINNLGSIEGIEKISDEELDVLINAEGYSNDEVYYVRMIVEQLMFELNEIIKSISGIEQNIEISSITYKDKSDAVELYRTIWQTFDENLSVYFALKLKKDFGSVQAVINEYLFCLQINVDLALYISDKDEYEKCVMEKSTQLIREEAITIEDISNYIVGTLSIDEPEEIVDGQLDNQVDYMISDPSISTPKDYAPQDPRPEDPTQELMNEINKINKLWR